MSDIDAQPGANPLSAEERAEEIVERLVSDGSRWLSRMIGRVREEAEDILAEGRELRGRAGSAPPPAEDPAVSESSVREPGA